MLNGQPDPAKSDVHALRHDLLEADDVKIMRILAIMEDVSDPAVNQALLDPLRPRLASLKPLRPLRFGRLLLMPLDPLIVPASAWKAEDPAVPRTVLSAIFRTVRAGLGSEVSFIDKLIAGFKVDAPLALTLAGEALWPRAAEILSSAPVPVDWAESGLKAEMWPRLAKSIAAVLRRASQLHRLAQDARTGALELDDEAVSDIMRRNADEPPEAYAMIVRLILLQAPHATPLLRKIVLSSRSVAEKVVMRQAIDREVDRVLSDMEESAGFDDEIGRVGLADATAEVRRMATLLREVELDTSMVERRPRLRAIREKLDLACQARFASGIKDGLVAPLSRALEPVDAARQTGLEMCARDLRRLDTVARKVSDSASYGMELQRASQAMREAAAAGILTPMRQLRLIEILSGPEVAEAIYMRDKTTT